ncbi:MAG TPA: hypothetical protein ENH44_04645, partial [Actinobacteria bacterium]|nr:hypothetical protein [Actinomycetota bacterium]
MKPTPYIISVSSPAEAAVLMRRLGVAEPGIELMAPRVPGQMARVSGLSPRIANILKQEALSLGGDAALPAAAYSLENGECGALVMGSPALLAELADKLA